MCIISLILRVWTRDVESRVRWFFELGSRKSRVEKFCFKMHDSQLPGNVSFLRKKSSRLKFCNNILRKFSWLINRNYLIVCNFWVMIITNSMKMCSSGRKLKFFTDFHIFPGSRESDPNSLQISYLIDKIKRLQPSRSFRSCDGYKAIVSRAHKVRLEDRAFSIIGPKLWNSLPITIRSAPSISNFKFLLKLNSFALLITNKKKLHV